MRIEYVSLRQYRNYEKCEFEPCPGINVLLGDNGQGKTNLLEAVYLCCTGRSHRTRTDKELIHWGADFARVDIRAQQRDGSHDVQIILPAAGGRKVKIGGVELSRSGELLGNVRGVLFAPEDLRNVKEGPGERRRMIDMTLSQLKPAYYFSLQRYNHIMKQRNELLHNAEGRPAMLATLDTWDEQLANTGAELMRYRRDYIERLSGISEETYREISGGKEALSVRYHPSVTGGDTPEDFCRALFAVRDRDIRMGTTSCGAHRDEVDLCVNGHEVRTYGSQGQQRTAALALRLSELDVMKEETGEWPVLMLDDVMSELDPSRRRQLLGRLEGVQTLVTCTDVEDLGGARIGAAWRVKNAVLEKM